MPGTVKGQARSRASDRRFAFGPGYRVYYTRRGNVVVIMLCGGDKGSQQSDIRKAKALAAEYED